MSEEKTLFKRVDYDVQGLIKYIEMGDIGLPDIQRPFVWSAAKVRDLFDLAARRQMMAKVIRAGFKRLSAAGAAQT